MRFGRGLDPFIKWFYVCGLSCYPSFDAFLTVKSKNKTFMKLFPTGALIVFTVVTAIATCVCKFLNDPDNKHGANTLFVNTLTLMVTTTLCAIQMVFLSPYFDEICSQISNIERLCWRKFSFDLNAFRRHFSQRAFITLASFILPVVIKLYAKPMTWDNFFVTIGLATLRAFMFLILLQVYFYVDLLDHMLQCFAEHIETRASTASTATVQTVNFHSPAAKQLKAEILHFKLLHFNMWEISEMINHLFGWTIVIIFLQHFIYSIYNVYFAYFIITQPSLDIIILLRTYRIPISLILHWQKGISPFICFAQVRPLIYGAALSQL